MKFTEAQLEDAIIQLLGQQGFPHVDGMGLEHDTGDSLTIKPLTKSKFHQTHPISLTS